MDEGEEEEEEEEEEELDHANIIAQYGGFKILQWGRDNEEEVAAEDDRGKDAFGDAIRDALRAAKPRKAILLCKARGTEKEGGGPAKEAAGSSEKASSFGL